MSENQSLDSLRERIDQLNRQLLTLLNQRAELVRQVNAVKDAKGLPKYDPIREKAQIQALVAANLGPMSPEMVSHVFREIFRASLTYLEQGPGHELLVTRKSGAPRTVMVGSVPVGGGNRPLLIAGPCSVESRESLEPVAEALARLGVPILRGGTFKPRTSPYDFQGLGMEGVELLSSVGQQHALATVTEVTDPAVASAVADKVSMLQVGARNMFNYELLKVLARLGKPILLKRSFGARVDELLLAAEYIFKEGNSQVVLCERGIRTFETSTRSTLDLSALCLLKEQTELPVLVDVSHAAGRKDILLPLAKAALAAGADGVMVEVHPYPQAALSDGSQQMDLNEFEHFRGELAPYLR